jgi:hypothetical protein
MDAATKLQLVQTAAQCVHTEQQQERVEIGSESLHLKKEQNNLSQVAHSLNLSEIQKRTFQQELKGFKSSCADSLVAGLFVMSLCMCTKIFNFAHQWTGMLETCTRIDLALSHDAEDNSYYGQSSSSSSVLLSLPLSYLYVWAYSFLSSFLGRSLCLLKLVLARAGGYLLVLYMSGKLFHQLASLVSTYEKAPVTVILLLLGLAVGSVLKTCVFHWGGSSSLFFALWMLLCSTHCVIVVKAPEVLTALKIVRRLPNSNNQTTMESMHNVSIAQKRANAKKKKKKKKNKTQGENRGTMAPPQEPAAVTTTGTGTIWIQWKLLLLHLYLIAVLPAATGLLPFYAKAFFSL